LTKLTAVSTFSGVIQLEAPASSAGPHREGHQAGPIGVSAAIVPAGARITIVTIARDILKRRLSNIDMTSPVRLGQGAVSRAGRQRRPAKDRAKDNDNDQKMAASHCSDQTPRYFPSFQ
jgi:hypothetical protein